MAPESGPTVSIVQYHEGIGRLVFTRLAKLGAWEREAPSPVICRSHWNHYAVLLVIHGCNNHCVAGPLLPSALSLPLCELSPLITTCSRRPPRPMSSRFGFTSRCLTASPAVQLSSRGIVEVSF